MIHTSVDECLQNHEATRVLHGSWWSQSAEGSAVRRLAWKNQSPHTCRGCAKLNRLPRFSSALRIFTEVNSHVDKIFSEISDEKQEMVG